MYQDVLIPTDGSDGTRRSIGHGLTIADQFDATIHALSVVPRGPLGTLQNDAATPAAHRAVDRVETEATQAGVDVRTAVTHGVPHEEILTYVADHDVDMVVMGTQGRTGLDRVLVGSVTERLVRMAEVPVVTVRLTKDVRITDAEEAARIAREAYAAESPDAAADAPTLAEQPHRTSASWVVVLEADAGAVHVHVDALTGEASVVDNPK